MLTLAPLYRQSIGFDQFSDLFDTIFRQGEDTTANYPPYNVEKHGENTYKIVMAVAGFGKNDIEIVSQENQLTISGRVRQADDAPETDEGRQYLYKGIATRSFERRFRLSDHVRVTDAALVDGLLTITLVREVPEAQKPRVISINSEASNQQTIEAQQQQSAA